MATCCDCSESTEGWNVYITQQYTDCCAGCFCEPEDCFYVEAGTPSNPNAQTGVFQLSKNSLVQANGCYYTGAIDGTSFEWINIFPPRFSGDYLSPGGNGNFVNTGDFWQIYEISSTNTYDRSWCPICSGCEHEWWYDPNLYGTGYKGPGVTYNIGLCCMTGECNQDIYSRNYNFYSEIYDPPYHTYSHHGAYVFDEGLIQLNPTTCGFQGEGEYYSTVVYLEYYDGEWHLFAGLYGMSEVEYSPCAGFGPYEDCEADLTNSEWCDDGGYGNYVILS